LRARAEWGKGRDLHRPGARSAGVDRRRHLSLRVPGLAGVCIADTAVAGGDGGQPRHPRRHGVWADLLRRAHHGGPDPRRIADQHRRGPGRLEPMKKSSMVLGFLLLVTIDTFVQVAFKFAGENTLPVSFDLAWLSRVAREPWLVGVVVGAGAAFATY